MMKRQSFLKAEDATLPPGNQGLILIGGMRNGGGTIPLTEDVFVLSTLSSIRTLHVQYRRAGPGSGVLGALQSASRAYNRGILKAGTRIVGGQQGTDSNFTLKVSSEAWSPPK
jgi:hypothetical protein